ncbi:MAG: element excision factor XisI family protein [Nostoc sp.]|uniref:element excision factor XisI family protein n=1 Tax=Nostoc sp. TaxID=1180 RepID=UPI002FEF4BAF
MKTLLTNYASDHVSDNNVKLQIILDTERNHYQWMNVGWQSLRRAAPTQAYCVPKCSFDYQLRAKLLSVRFA